MGEVGGEFVHIYMCTEAKGSQRQKKGFCAKSSVVESAALGAQEREKERIYVRIFIDGG